MGDNILDHLSPECLKLFSSITMLRFSCFSSHNHNQRSKTFKKFGGIMHSYVEEKAQGSTSTKSKSDDNNHSNNSAEQLTSPSSHEDCWNSENVNIDLCPEDSEGCHRRMHMEKSQSLGCIVDKQRGTPGGDVTDDDEIEGGVPFNNSHENFESSFNDQQEHYLVQPYDKIPDNAHHESLFSIEALQQFAREQHADLDEHYADHVDESGYFSSNEGPALARSRSVNNLRVGIAITTEDVSTDEVMGLRTRSFENLHFPQESDLDRDGSACNVEAENEHLCCRQFDPDGKSSDEYDSHNYNMDGNAEKELDTDFKLKNLQQESPTLNCDELNPEEFSVRRIQEWISKIDIEGDCIVEEPGESSGSFSSKEPLVEVMPTTQPDAKSHLGMEVAYNYISSLTPMSAAAQMANLGLVAVPFLSAFVGLRVLNLSGNAIVRITAGSLPRGLHMLNLSKNKIAVIEGLRDLTRLRVLDLSYNRIIRIGHGLASCSSLKELYLAGNKISDVEGLHRLLKLNILDLRSNKISTAKGLGQLAANYCSLQAINLGRNPAQRNVGDEQLKKFLLSILPNLVHYNKQSIRASSSMKEILDRPPRSAAHHFDRSKRSESKLPRRGSHSSALHKLSSDLIRSSHAAGSSSRQSKSRNIESRHMHLPPIASKLQYHLPEVDKKPISLQPINPIRRIRSEGNLS